MEKIRTITFGDVHGRSNWKINLFGDYISFEELITAHEHGWSDEYVKEYNFNNFDKIIFVGDYVDSFHVGNAEMLKNLEDLIILKTLFPDKVILLFGNHDISYYWDQPCSGFRSEMFQYFNNLYSQRDKFQAAYQIDNYLWTHAGVSRGWWNLVQHKITNLDWKFNKYLDEFNEADIINCLFESKDPLLSMVSIHRGGISKVGGPFWADKAETCKKPLEGFHQIVGHTPQKKIHEVWPYGKDSKKRKPTSVTYIDVMHLVEHNENEPCEALHLDI